MRLFKLLVVGGATVGLLALLVLTLAAPATATYTHKVTICHLPPGNPENVQTIEVDESAVPAHLEHGDYFGECKPPPPVDVCPNLEGNQATVPDGYHLGEDENGRPICVQNPPPVDVCPNLEGDQSTVPDGYTLVDDECVVIPPPPDVCPNIDGAQSQVPTGMVVDANGNCVTPVPPQVTGDASVICLLPAGIYQLSGHVDGQTADSVSPSTLPGNTKGVTNVTVTRGDTSVRTAITTLGDCGTTTTVTVVPPAATPPPVVTPPTVNPPVVKPKPKAKPPVKHKTPVKKAKPKPKHKPNKKPHKAPKTLSI